MSELVDRLAGFGAGIDLDSVPPSVVHQARRQLVDTVACVLEGSSHQPIRAMAELVSEQGPCSVLGTRSQMGPMRAAFINASAGAWSDMDGGNRFAGGAHVAVHAIPAALAMAEQTKARGRRLLEAIIYGYEVGARLGVGTKLRPGIHPHGTHSTVGAAAACGLMQDFGTSQLARTIDVATSLTLSTSFQAATEGATVRNAYAGVGASMGVLAADLAKAGFTGEADGLGTTFGNIIGTSFEPVKAGEDLGERWEIERSWFKQHAGARPIHAVLDVLAQLDREARVRPEEVV
jgi:2-methylcitrate dehydratase PrpD